MFSGDRTQTWPYPNSSLLLRSSAFLTVDLTDVTSYSATTQHLTRSVGCTYAVQMKESKRAVDLKKSEFATFIFLKFLAWKFSKFS
jgi:cobalamin biosynthesis protein CobD/CbiB